MAKYNNLRHERSKIVWCGRCNVLLNRWPRGGAEITNDSGTQMIRVCTKCLDEILNMPSVQVIKDNLNRDMPKS